MEHTTADSGSAVDLREEAARRVADSVRASDPQMAQILQGELERQQNSLILIPSENYPSRAVLEVQGCIMSNKYAEGYPGRRVYHGCEWVDQAETLAIERARELFGAEHANVQPAAGAPANMAAYYALLEPGDSVGPVLGPAQRPVQRRGQSPPAVGAAQLDGPRCGLPDVQADRGNGLAPRRDNGLHPLLRQGKKF